MRGKIEINYNLWVFESLWQIFLLLNFFNPRVLVTLWLNKYSIYNIQ